MEKHEAFSFDEKLSGENGNGRRRGFLSFWNHLGKQFKIILVLALLTVLAVSLIPMIFLVSTSAPIHHHYSFYGNGSTEGEKGEHFHHRYIS